MKDPTTNEGQITDASAPHDGDIIRFTRPESTAPEEWAKIVASTRAKLDELVEEIGCVGRPWCHLDQWPDEHKERHASAPVNLAHFEEGADDYKGWWCWLTQDRGIDEPIEITIEGTGRNGKLDRATMSPHEASLVLLATETPEAREALWVLFRQVNES